jgi:aminoglycoside 3-N-acetyltransferase
MKIKNIDGFKEFIWDSLSERFENSGFSNLENIDLKIPLIEKGIIDSLDLLNIAVALREKNVYMDLSAVEGEIDTSISGLFSMLKFDEDEENQKKINDPIKQILSDLGIRRGDNLLLHSSFVTLSNFVDTPKEVVNEILEIIGDQGTLLAPTSNLEIFKQGKYDSEKTSVQSDFGAISEEIRILPGAIRSINPFDSVSGFGPLAEKICGGYNEECYGEESPWKKVLNYKFKLVMLGVDFFYASMVHAAEVDAKVPYRKWIDYKNKMVNKGIETDFNIKIFAMDLSTKRYYNKVYDEILDSGDMLRKSKLVKSYSVDMEYIYNYFIAKIKDDPYIFVSP